MYTKTKKAARANAITRTSSVPGHQLTTPLGIQLRDWNTREAQEKRKHRTRETVPAAKAHVRWSLGQRQALEQEVVGAGPMGSFPVKVVVWGCVGRIRGLAAVQNTMFHFQNAAINIKTFKNIKNGVDKFFPASKDKFNVCKSNIFELFFSSFCNVERARSSGHSKKNQKHLL